MITSVSCATVTVSEIEVLAVRPAEFVTTSEKVSVACVFGSRTIGAVNEGFAAVLLDKVTAGPAV